jgi:hypothetical protein
MAGRNHVVPIFPATSLISHGFRLWFVVLSLVLNVTEVRCHVGLASHSNTAEGRISERFFSWLPRRNEPKDGSLYHTFPKSFRMTNRTSYNWCATTYPWKRSSLVGRATGSIRSTLPYWAVVPTRRLFASNGGKGLALGSVLVWMVQKCCGSDPVKRSFYFWKHAGPIVVSTCTALAAHLNCGPSINLTFVALRCVGTL